jgi:hypothetical protein
MATYSKFGISNGDYKLFTNFHIFDVNMIKLLKFRNFLPWFPTNKTFKLKKKKKKKNNIERKHKKSIPWKKFTQKNRIEHIKVPCI